ncbi:MULTISPECIES: hypothetical protein [Anabaena]
MSITALIAANRAAGSS